MDYPQNDEMIYFFKKIKSMLPTDIDKMEDEELCLLWDEVQTIYDSTCSPDKRKSTVEDLQSIFQDLQAISTSPEVKYKKERLSIILTYLSMYPASYSNIARKLYPDADADIIKYKRTQIFNLLTSEENNFLWLKKMMQAQSGRYYKGGKG